MAKKVYKINLGALLESEVFAEASREELRVLLAIAAAPELSGEELAAAARTSLARTRAAVALFEESSIIEHTELTTDEFDENSISDGIEEESAVTVARDIRDKGLSALISECARLMDKPALSTVSVKKIVALHTQYALSEEYILALAAHLCDGGRLTPARLSAEAIRLTERGIDTPEALYAYLEEKRKMTDTDARLRRLFGLYGRKITKTEHEYFTKWVDEYGYSEEIIGEAYDIGVANTNKFAPAYMDKILSRWHECGCKTLADCLMRQETDKLALAATKGTAGAKTRGSREAEKPQSFDVDDILKRALSRSFESAGEED